MSGELWQAFRRGDEAAVLMILENRPELRHAGGELPLRAACWYGLESVAHVLVEEWAAEIGEDMPEIARRRGHDGLAVWLEQRRIMAVGDMMDQLQMSFI